MAKESKVSVSGRRVGYDAGVGDKYPMMVYRPDTSGAGGAPIGTPVHYSMRIKEDHGNAHLKTKAHWIIGTVPPPKEGKKRTFVAGRKWIHNGFVRYWGFVKWAGKRHYGWIDGLHLEKKKHKTALKVGSYDAYRKKVKRMMTRAWRYRKQYEGDPRNAYPVAALLKTDRDELLLYSNPVESSDYVVDRVPHPKDGKKRRLWFWVLAILAPSVAFTVTFFLLAPTKKVEYDKFMSALPIGTGIGFVLYVALGFVFSRMFKHGKMGCWF